MSCDFTEKCMNEAQHTPIHRTGYIPCVVEIRREDGGPPVISNHGTAFNTITKKLKGLRSLSPNHTEEIRPILKEHFWGIKNAKDIWSTHSKAPVSVLNSPMESWNQIGSHVERKAWKSNTMRPQNRYSSGNSVHQCHQGIKREEGNKSWKQLNTF